MSLVNLTLRIRHFNININIKKDEFKKPVNVETLIRNERLIQEAIERRNTFEAEFHQLNSYRY